MSWLLSQNGLLTVLLLNEQNVDLLPEGVFFDLDHLSLALLLLENQVSQHPSLLSPYFHLYDMNLELILENFCTWYDVCFDMNCDSSSLTILLLSAFSSCLSFDHYPGLIRLHVVVGLKRPLHLFCFHQKYFGYCPWFSLPMMEVHACLGLKYMLGVSSQLM